MHSLRQAGYLHNEVSHFAKPGFRSRHNSAYWKGIPYLGLGPSAHSFNRRERRWNIANNTIYVKSVNSGTSQRETEVLTPDQQLNETIMISLRTMEGIDLRKIETNWGGMASRRLITALTKYIDAGLIQLNNHKAQLTDEGMLRAVGIAADLFV